MFRGKIESRGSHIHYAAANVWNEPQWAARGPAVAQQAVQGAVNLPTTAPTSAPVDPAAGSHSNRSDDIALGIGAGSLSKDI